MEERRSYRRFNIALPIQYKFAAFQDGMTKASTLDVSANGLRFRVKDRPGVDEEVHLLITLPGGRTVMLAAKVVWCQTADREDYEIGLRISDTRSEDGKAFMDFYSQQMLGFTESHKDQGHIVR